MQNNNENLNINSLREQLRASRTSGGGKSSNKSYIPQNSNYAAPSPHVMRQPSLGQQLHQHKAKFEHLHLYWHYYIAAFTFILFHAIGIAPQYFPGMENEKSLYSQAPFIALLFLNLPAIAVFFGLRKLRRSLQMAARITESRGWTKTEWAGAAVMFAVMFYITFLKPDPLEAYMVPEAIKGPFDLTPREWIMAGVKCVGGAVMGVIGVRKFFGEE